MDRKDVLERFIHDRFNPGLQCIFKITLLMVRFNSNDKTHQLTHFMASQVMNALFNPDFQWLPVQSLGCSSCACVCFHAHYWLVDHQWESHYCRSCQNWSFYNIIREVLAMLVKKVRSRKSLKGSSSFYHRGLGIRTHTLILMTG